MILKNLKLSIFRVEQLGSGAIYCQLFDAIHPKVIKMGKVNWKAKREYEFVGNFKVLQFGFQRVGVDKSIPVMELVKAKLSDNLKFGNWFIRYFEENVMDFGVYDPEKKRSKFTFEYSFKKITNKIYKIFILFYIQHNFIKKKIFKNPKY